MLLKIKRLIHSLSVHSNTFRTQSIRKTAAYCATICAALLLLGCANTQQHTQSTIANDPLSPQNLQSSAAQINNMAQAEQIERDAIARQNAADIELKNNQAACYRQFFVNRCLDQQANIRNQIWDQAQIERSAARLYIRQAQAEQQRVALMQKVKAYQQKEAAKAAERARNAAEYAARQKAHAEKLAQAKAQEAAKAAQRAQNVEDYNAKVKRIEEIKRQRILKAQQPQPAIEVHGDQPRQREDGVRGGAGKADGDVHRGTRPWATLAEDRRHDELAIEPIADDHGAALHGQQEHECVTELVQ